MSFPPKEVQAQPTKKTQKTVIQPKLDLKFDCRNLILTIVTFKQMENMMLKIECK